MSPWTRYVACLATHMPFRLQETGQIPVKETGSSGESTQRSTKSGGGPRAGTEALDVRALGDTHRQVAFHPNLAGETIGLQQTRLSRQGGALLLAHRRRFAGDDLDTAGRATRVPAAASVVTNAAKAQKVRSRLGIAITACCYTMTITEFSTQP